MKICVMKKDKAFFEPYLFMLYSMKIKKQTSSRLLKALL
ncbi:hypothetical protein U753_01475 [Streptococcus pseudopneumoniae 5247]|nr:hypothetical protein U753_01475 [Streptococcus pseudopneumoniae 5247]